MHYTPPKIHLLKYFWNHRTFFKVKNQKVCNEQHEKKGSSTITANYCEQHRHTKAKKRKNCIIPLERESGLQYSNLLVHCSNFIKDQIIYSCIQVGGLQRTLSTSSGLNKYPLIGWLEKETVHRKQIFKKDIRKNWKKMPRLIFNFKQFNSSHRAYQQKKKVSLIFKYSHSSYFSLS